MCGSAAGGEYFNGYMAGFRLVRNGVVIPPAGGPTVPPTDIGAVLINFRPAIYDASPGSLVATESSIRLTGAVYTSADTYQWEPTSIRFVSGNYLTVTNADTVLQIGTGDFTIEMWVRVEGYPPANVGMNFLNFRSGGSSSASQLVIYIVSGGSLRYAVGGTNKIISTTGIPLSTWSHIAAVRSSGTTTLYLNGVQQGSFADTTSYTNAANWPVIGGSGSSSYNGYMQDLRITIGVARYTGTSFTLPTYAFIAASAPQ
jgi:hypothetical protein